MIQPFSLTVLRNYRELKNWITDPLHTRQLTEESVVETRARCISTDMQIKFYEIATCIYECILYPILIAAQEACKYFDLDKLALRIHVLHLHAKTSTIHLQALKTHRSSLICFSKNIPTPSSSDVYLHEPIERTKIKDPVLEKYFFSSKNDNQISFFHELGSCRGICYWFIYLYFKTKDTFSSPHLHIIRISQEFTDGAPAPAALLQSLHPVENFLNIKSKTLFYYLDNFIELKQNLLSCSEGIYTIGLGRHRINYIKISEEKAYIFDPNIGTIYFKRDQSNKSFNLIVKLAEKFAIQNDQPKVSITECRINKNYYSV